MTPAFVEPPDATMMPTSRRSPMAARSASPVMRQSGPVGTTRDSRPRRCRALSTEACAVSATATKRRPPAPIAADGQCRQVADRPATHEAPAVPLGIPAARHSNSITWFSAATAPAPSSHDSAEKLAADTIASIHTRCDRR